MMIEQQEKQMKESPDIRIKLWSITAFFHCNLNTFFPFSYAFVTTEQEVPSRNFWINSFRLAGD